MNYIKNNIIFLAFFAFVSIFVFLTIPRSVPESQSFIVVEDGDSFYKIANDISTAGILNSSIFTKVIYSVLFYNSNLHKGEYNLGKYVNYISLPQQFAKGHIVLYSVTIPEGTTSKEVVEILNKSEYLEGEISKLPKEGSLMPETYYFPRGELRSKIIDIMKKDHEKYMKSVIANNNSDNPYKSIKEVVTMASVIEKETSSNSERGVVAGVFLNRLKKGMKLQSDPTVAYGVGKKDLARITKSDIKNKNGYNTYYVKGLPIGPINNPGKAAINAALNPSKTEYYYFVANENGLHNFAKTLKEHNENVKQWRKVERKVFYNE